MIDSHSHLNDSKFDSDLKQVIERAKKNLKAVITLSDDYKANEKNLKISKEYLGFVFSCFGSGPISMLRENDFEKVNSFVFQNKKHMVAVGEVGLDYYWDKTSHAKQEENFIKFIELANELKKPIVVHSREAEEEALDLLEKKASTTVIMHSFEGSPELIKRAVDNDYFIGVTTKAVYSNKTKDLIKAIELSNLLTETDSPYLNPIKRRERNEPSNVSFLIKLISEETGEELEVVDKLTEKNAIKAFGLRNLIKKWKKI